MQSPQRVDLLARHMSRLRQLWQTATSILDLGTGPGSLLPLLNAYAPQAHIVGVDLTETMLAYARRRAGRAHLTEADAQRLPFRRAAFKAVICHAAFPHFTDKFQALLELRRILAPEGSLVIFHEMGREQVNTLHANIQNPVIQADRLPPGPQLETWLRQSGFEVIRLEDGPAYYLAIGRVR